MFWEVLQISQENTWSLFHKIPRGNSFMVFLLWVYLSIFLITLPVSKSRHLLLRFEILIRNTQTFVKVTYFWRTSFFYKNILFHLLDYGTFQCHNLSGTFLMVHRHKMASRQNHRNMYNSANNHLLQNSLQICKLYFRICNL